MARASLSKDRPAGVRTGRCPERVEEAHPELRLQIGNRMADRRLNSGEARSGRAEAPSFRDGDEDAHLIERK